jgi:pyruvate dehydrogenase E2 component (dihydrolipoamide acetyltransferase)
MPEIKMPKLSDTMTEGTLVVWKKKKGDKVSAGEVLAEIETDKATMEWESPEDGTLTEIYVEEGGKVNVGDRIAFIGSEGEKPAAESKAVEPKPAPKEKTSKEKEVAPTAKEEKKPVQKKGATEKTKKPEPEKEPAEETSVEKKTEESAKRSDVSPGARVKASPLARRIAAELGVDISAVKGTGPDGRVTETDVRAAAKAGKTSGAPTEISANIRSRISLTGMRRVIAERLVASKGPVPHFYLNIEIDAAPLMNARAELKAAGEEADAAKITVNDFILKAAVDAAVRVPAANASFTSDAIVQYDDVNLAVAVAIEDGLVTPVIRAAQKKSLREISEAVKDLVHRARNKRMKPEEFQGGTFTVSNLGSYGIDSFSAIINPPQGFILSIGAIGKRAVIDNSDQIVVGHRMSIGMSCDHRVIDGALGAEYLKELRRSLENPALLLL